MPAFAIFAIYRSEEGELSMRNHFGKIPVNPAYLEHLLDGRQLMVEPGRFRLVDSLFVEDAIEEAQANLAHQITSAEIDKRRLTFHLVRAMSNTVSPTGCSSEAARMFGFSEAA